MNFMGKRKLWVLLAAICLTGSLLTLGFSAQQQAAPPVTGYGPPPPPPGFGSMTSLSGRITQFNYGPNALPKSFMLNHKAMVHFPPDLGCAIGGTVKVGDTVKVEGLASTSYYGTTTLELQNLSDSTNGRQFAIPQPGSATAYTGSGTIKQLNYGPQGEINGFWLNKVLVHLPPMAPGSSSPLQVGASASVSGYAHAGINNVTVVDASSLAVDGQTISVHAPPPRPPASGAAAPPAPGAAPPPPPGA